jgi:hypothetical protein
MNKFIESEVKTTKRVELAVYIVPATVIALLLLTNYLQMMPRESYGMWNHEGSSFVSGLFMSGPTMVNIILLAGLLTFHRFKFSKLLDYEENKRISSLMSMALPVRSGGILLIVWAVLLVLPTLVALAFYEVGLGLVGMVWAVSVLTNFIVGMHLLAHAGRISGQIKPYK